MRLIEREVTASIQIRRWRQVLVDSLLLQVWAVRMNTKLEGHDLGEAMEQRLCGCSPSRKSNRELDQVSQREGKKES